MRYRATVNLPSQRRGEVAWWDEGDARLDAYVERGILVLDIDVDELHVDPELEAEGPAVRVLDGSEWLGLSLRPGE